MSDEVNTTFIPEEILEHAKENVNALCLVSVAYLKEHALSMDEFWAFAGRQFAPSWEQGQTAKEVARGTALEMVSGGCNLRSLSGDESQAEAVIGGWPSEESLAFFGLTQEEADTVWGVFGPIAESLGYGYEWHRQGDEVTVTFSRRTDE
jgi:hypothetical protein